MNTYMSENTRILEKDDAPTRQSSGSSPARRATPMYSNDASFEQKGLETGASLGEGECVDGNVSDGDDANPVLSGRDAYNLEIWQRLENIPRRTDGVQHFMQDSEDAKMVTVSDDGLVGDYEACTFNAAVPAISGKRVDSLPPIS